MCDLNRLSGFIIAAQIAYIVATIMLGAAILNSALVFSSVANAALVIAILGLLSLSIGMIAAAIVELDKCLSGGCAADLRVLRGNLVGIAANLSVYVLTIAALAIIAIIPFAGAVALSIVLISLLGISGVYAIVMNFNFYRLAEQVNNCHGGRPLFGAQVFAIIAAIISIGVAILTPIGVLVGPSKVVAAVIVPSPLAYQGVYHV